MTRRAMGFVGFHKSGKTTLVAQVAEHLRSKGHKVGIIKRSHHSLDLGTTDTARLAGTGCAVAGFGPDQTMILLPEQKTVGSVWPMLEAEILLVEGGKQLGFLPRIILSGLPGLPAMSRSADSLADDPRALDNGLALACWGEGGAAGLKTLASVQDVADMVLEHGFFLPDLDCGACGREDCLSLAREIVAGTADPKDCRAMPTSFAVTVNGMPLGMNPFVATIMASTIKGMLKELKGYAPGRIEIRLEAA